MQTITALEFEQISKLLHDQCGIYLHKDQDYLVQTRLSDFAQSLGLTTFSQLLLRLQVEPDRLLPTVINLMTTNETLWFRDSSCWNALEKKILPELLKKIERGYDIKIWIAGCSTGQEAYSLAILIDELCQAKKKPELARQFSIRAMDISQTALQSARLATYNTFEINRGLSLARRNKYFEQTQQQTWVLRPNIRLRVHFDTINLTRNFSHLGKFDLILCRNVTIYFTPTVRSQILSTMVTMLTAEGALLLGATESLWQQRNNFKTVEFEGCIYVKPI
ncbi:MAG: protein-glutamate O-methyltransferase CheR [Methylococcaceae bacterium]